MSKDQLMDKVNELVAVLGAEDALTELVKAMDSRELEDDLRYIDRMHDLNWFSEDEDEEY